MATENSEVIIQLLDVNGVALGSTISVPVSLTRDHIEQLLISQLQESGKWTPDDGMRYTFILESSEEIKSTIYEALEASKSIHSGESVYKILYIPVSIYSVRPITRCTSSLEGHSEAVLCVEFSPDGTKLASGSGDATVRLWDLETCTPLKTLLGHSNWVQCVSWSPDGRFLASCGMDTKVIAWCPETGTSRHLNGHNKAVVTLAWQPLHHVDMNIRDYCLLASGSLDGGIRIWDCLGATCLRLLSGHTRGVTQILWSGYAPNRLFSASKDTLVKVWDTNSGQLLHDLKGHAHWVNTLTCNTHHHVKCGIYTPEYFQKHPNVKPVPINEAIQMARESFSKFMRQIGSERLLSGSDDNTMFIWHPHERSKKPIRLTGHQQVINHVCFSSDARFFASASFDKSIRIWCGVTGKYLKTLRGHIGRVYRLAWSCRGSLLVSASSDATLKLWDAESGKLKFDLPGHADEAYTVDWSNCGKRVASGGKDKILKIWSH